MIAASLYILGGGVGFVAHFPTLPAIHSDDLLVELTELVALVAGIFVLRGQTCSTWLGSVFHVVISLSDGVVPVVVHGLFCVAVVWMLFRPAVSAYFRRINRESL